MEDFLQILEVGGGVTMDGYRMLVLVFGLILCTCGCGNDAYFNRSDDLSHYRKFLFESTAFDYCGYLYTDQDIEVAANGYSDDDVLRRYLSECGQEGKSVMFFECLKEMEKQVIANHGVENWGRVEEVVGVMFRQRKSVVSKTERFPYFRYEHNLVRLLYSVARIVEQLQDSSESNVEFLSRALPDDLFTLDLSSCDWIAIRDDRLTRLKHFKFLLRISCNMKSNSETNNCQIVNKTKSCFSGFLNSENSRCYSRGREWMLVYGNRRLVNFDRISTSSFIVPQIMDSKFVFLSSNYSKRREMIFREGEKADGNRYVVKHGRICVQTD